MSAQEPVSELEGPRIKGLDTLSPLVATGTRVTFVTYVCRRPSRVSRNSGRGRGTYYPRRGREVGLGLFLQEGLRTKEPLDSRSRTQGQRTT